jgi:phosphoribosylformylglycinamidine synthase subunit PurQ / glutaminase
MPARVAVLRFPGSNCEAETLRAVERVGLAGRIVRWNENPEELERYAASLRPGGFCSPDRLRAGAVAARLPLCAVLARRARAGAPVLGICNGAQILVEAGLVPGADGAAPEDPVRMALAPNAIRNRDGYYTRWVVLGPGPAAAASLFTAGLEESLPMPMAHGEGRFLTMDRSLDMNAHLALEYTSPDGSPAAFPWNPNGSLGNAAGVINRAGNVLALMPHPERAQDLAQVPETFPGAWGARRREAAGSAGLLDADGPGLILFRALAKALR